MKKARGRGTADKKAPEKNKNKKIKKSSSVRKKEFSGENTRKRKTV